MGYHSHWFNLAMKDITKDHVTRLFKGHTLMGKLSYDIPSAKLRQLTSLRPKLNNQTRWCSTYDMLRRYVEIKEQIFKIDGVDIAGLLLDPDDD